MRRSVSLFRETEESHYRLATELCRGCVLVAVDGASRSIPLISLSHPQPPPHRHAMSSLSPLLALSLSSVSRVSLLSSLSLLSTTVLFNPFRNRTVVICPQSPVHSRCLNTTIPSHFPFLLVW